MIRNIGQITVNYTAGGPMTSQYLVTYDDQARKVSISAPSMPLNYGFFSWADFKNMNGPLTIIFGSDSQEATEQDLTIRRTTAPTLGDAVLPISLAHMAAPEYGFKTVESYSPEFAAIEPLMQFLYENEANAATLFVFDEVQSQSQGVLPVAKKFLQHIDLLKNQLQNAVIHKLAAAPSSPAEGQIYYDTTQKKFFIYDGTEWLDCSVQLSDVNPASLGVGQAASAGTSAEASRADHQHALPGVATTSAAGFLSPTDKQAYDGAVADLNAATSEATPETLALRDANGNIKVATPSDPAHAATKGYVDSLAQGLSPKQAVRAATTGNISLSAAPAAIDGVTLANGDRVLVKDQTNQYENGIYIFNGAGSAMTRAADADAWAELVSASVFVSEGTINADQLFVCISDAGGTLGTTTLEWVQFASLGATPTADGTTIDVNGSNQLQLKNAASYAHKASDVIGDGVSTTIPFLHNLGTMDIVVSVRTNASPSEIVECAVKPYDTNRVDLEFAVAPGANEYRVTVMG